MSKMLQIRNMPKKLHRALKIRAAQGGVSMSEFVLREIRKVLAKPSREELIARVAARRPVKLDPSPAEIIREGREGR